MFQYHKFFDNNNRLSIIIYKINFQYETRIKGIFDQEKRKKFVDTTMHIFCFSLCNYIFDHNLSVCHSFFQVHYFLVSIKYPKLLLKSLFRIQIIKKFIKLCQILNFKLCQYLRSNEKVFVHRGQACQTCIRFCKMQISLFYFLFESSIV